MQDAEQRVLLCHVAAHRGAEPPWSTVTARPPWSGGTAGQGTVQPAVAGGRGRQRHLRAAAGCVSQLGRQSNFQKSRIWPPCSGCSTAGQSLLVQEAGATKGIVRWRRRGRQRAYLWLHPVQIGRFSTAAILQVQLAEASVGNVVQSAHDRLALTTQVLQTSNYRPRCTCVLVTSWQRSVTTAQASQLVVQALLASAQQCSSFWG